MVILIRIPHHPLHGYIVLFHLGLGLCEDFASWGFLYLTPRQFATDFAQSRVAFGDPGMIVSVWTGLIVVILQQSIVQRGREDRTEEAAVAKSFHFGLRVSLLFLSCMTTFGKF